MELRLPQASLPVLLDDRHLFLAGLFLAGRLLLSTGRLPLRAGLLFLSLTLPLFPLLRWGPLRGDQLRVGWPGGGHGLGGDVRLPRDLLRRLTRPGCGDGRRGLG
jgi:hypothetical protein